MEILDQPYWCITGVYSRINPDTPFSSFASQP
eukprot:COSAG06_NODE_28245_length_578_cov_0.630480_1_plen_31_part_10